MPYTEVDEMNMKRRTGWRAANSRSVRVPPTSVDWISSFACERERRGAMHDDIDPRHGALDGGGFANIGLHDVDDMPLGIVKRRDIHGADLESRQKQRHRLMPRNPAPPVTKIDADMADLP